MSYHTTQQTKIQSLIQSKLSPSSWDAVECFFNPSLETRSPSTYKKEKGHYVYIQFAHGDTEPFYVGQGNHRGGGFFRRCYDMQSKQQRRTKRHPNCWIDKASLGFYAWLINNLSQEDANTLEIVLIAHYGRLDEGQGPLFNRTSGGKRTGSRIPATGWHHSEETKEKIRQKAQGRVASKETRKLMSQQRRGVAKTEAHKKAISQAHLNRNQTTPQARSKCLYCDVVASPANLATYHNDHCIHRPGYEATNQARLKATQWGTNESSKRADWRTTSMIASDVR